jgi:hypothetical protein
VLADGVIVGRIFKERASRAAVDVDACHGTSRKPRVDTWLRRNARGRYGGIREKLAAGMIVIVAVRQLSGPTTNKSPSKQVR